MAEYRIDELARLAETTVRNVRVYQDRGLLAPPRREGRVGLYSEAHLARLRLIGQLLRRGYTFANIGEMFRVWERGGDLSDILGFESAIGDAWSDEIADYLTLNQLQELFGKGVTSRTSKRSLELNVLERDGLRFRVPSPRLLLASLPINRALPPRGDHRDGLRFLAPCPRQRHALTGLASLPKTVDPVLDRAENLRGTRCGVAQHLLPRVAEQIPAVFVPASQV